MKIEKSKYPIKLLEDLEKLTNQLRKIRSENSDVIEEHKGALIDHDDEDSDYEFLRFKYEDEAFGFYFTVDSMEFKSNNTVFEFYVCPTSETTTNSSGLVQGTSETIVNQFQKWTSILKRYKKLKFNDPITEASADEIFENIKILDDDADEAPFEVSQQIFLLSYLEKAKEVLLENSDNHDVEDIIIELDDFKKDVTRLPKNASMKKLSIILAMTKKQSLKLFKSMMIILKKDLMKKVLTEGYEYVDGILKLLHSLPG